MPPRVLARCSSSFTIGSDAFDSDSDESSSEVVIGGDADDRYSRASTGSTSTSEWKTPRKGAKTIAAAAKAASQTASPRHLTPDRQRSIASSRHITPERQRSMASSRNLTPERQQSQNRRQQAKEQPSPHPEASTPKASPVNRALKADVGSTSKKGVGSTSKKAMGRSDSARNLRTPPPLLPSLKDQQGAVPTHNSNSNPNTPGKSQYTQFSIRKREQSTPGALTAASSPKAGKDLALAPRHSLGGDRSSAPPIASQRSVEPLVPVQRDGPPSPTRTPPPASQQRGTSMPLLPRSNNHALTPTIKSKAPPVIQPAPLATPFANQKQSHDSKPTPNNGSAPAASVTPPRDLNLNPAQPISRSQTPTRQRKPAAPQLLPSLQAQMSEAMIVVHDADAANKLGLTDNIPHSQMPTESSHRALTPNLGARNSGYFQWSIRRNNGTDSPRASFTGEAS